MQRYRTLKREDGGSVVPNGDGGLVFYTDAEAAIEKARREGVVTGFNSIPNMAHARADERDRIRGKYRRLRSDHLAEEAADIAMADPAQEPKPLEKMEPGSFHSDLDVQRFNSLVDAVNDILRRLNEISPGNRP